MVDQINVSHLLDMMNVVAQESQTIHDSGQSGFYDYFAKLSSVMQTVMFVLHNSLLVHATTLY